ncbi:MAG: iron-sulfur cluster assembly accessory protein [Nitrosospira sp.]|nr:iron-sulfur cluster assembly accessory protein [Nitrosospira sp.]
MAIILSERAAKHICQQITRRGKGLALRVGMKKVGCSGFAYTFDYADEIQIGDQLFESYDVHIVIDAHNLPFLDGSHIDFVREGLNDLFKLDNPNVANMCGCGESFSLKESAEI